MMNITKIRRGLEIMNVIKLKRQNNALDIALMVESATKTERQEYDETAIVDALVREANCDKMLAREVAGTVTERLKNANVSEVSTSLIRSMVNNVLLEKGLNKELKSNSETSIPFYNKKMLNFLINFLQFFMFCFSHFRHLRALHFYVK